jgi:hypothetical protein
MKLKHPKNTDTKEVYMLDKETKLKNVVVSNEDPYDKLFSSTKEEVWYSDTFDF